MLNKPKWTPGPWKVEHTEYDVEYTYHYSTIYDQKGRHLFSSGTHNANIGLEEEQATAHLIAAAPELDDACEPDTLDRTADYFDGLDNPDGDNFHKAFIAHLRRLAKLQRAAKAKARGESPPC